MSQKKHLRSSIGNSFTGKVGFILAAAGSAIGLGNIWRFPYLTAKYGGGIFLVTYLVLVLTFGYSLLISENAIGRMTRRGPVGAYRKLCKGKGLKGRLISVGGWLNSIVPLLILPYYCVIGGWVTKYTALMLSSPVSGFDASRTAADTSGKLIPASAHYFQNFITGTWEPMLYFLLFMGIVAVIVALGVEKGVERFNRILMPLLFIMIVAVCIFTVFVPGAKAGFIYYLKPDFSRFGLMTLVAAMGQLFFSLSIAMGIMITYGSYMPKEESITSCVSSVQFFDTAVAFLSGMMIIPAVVAFGGEKAAEAAGPGLVFITMPQVFARFPLGQISGAVFFMLVLFAAATSAISLLETNVQTLSQQLAISRRTALLTAVLETFIIGIVTILGYSVLSHVHPLSFLGGKPGEMDILDSLDFISNSVLMPVAAIFTTLLVTFVVGFKAMEGEIRRNNAVWKREFLYRFCMKFIVIPFLLIIFLNSIGVF